MSRLSTAALEALLSRPRTLLAALPTRLLEAPRLAARLGCPDVRIKMDAETGFALGGNKVRKLEYELFPERLEGVTCLITAGGAQSNHCRVTAGFAARAGLECVLVVNGPEPERPTGNALLHRLFGATIRVVDGREARAPALEEARRQVEGAGGRPLVVPIGASTGLGCLGYARAAHELVGQLDALPPRPGPTRVFLSTSSSGTLAGLVLGLAILGRRDVIPIGVSADAPVDELRSATLRIAHEGAEILAGGGPDAAEGPGAPSHARRQPRDGRSGGAPPGLRSALDDFPFELDADQVGDGYGIPTPSSRAALDLFARLEGVVLDPTYTAKAAAGMLDWVRTRGAPPEGRIVFLHTGGHPGLLA